MLPGQVTTPLSRLRFPAAVNTATAQASAATIHRGPLHSELRIQRYIIAHRHLHILSLHSLICGRAFSGISPLAADRWHSSTALRLLPALLGKAQ